MNKKGLVMLEIIIIVALLLIPVTVSMKKTIKDSSFANSNELYEESSSSIDISSSSSGD